MTRTGYHHGDLRAALIDSGLQLTRTGGPEALTIREATRRAGVSPNAAYRHFTDREALLGAVAIAIQDRMAARMLEPANIRSSARSRAQTQLRTVGLGYIEFALDEPGWFAVAFFGGSDLSTLNGDGLAPPFRALVEALDAMVDTGVLQPDQRIGAEWPCWSAVHGFAELALRGPLRGTPRPDLEALAQRTVDCIIAGLAQ
ncbi:TetR/AcrR family transcriptional regulator [[Mycobacterium] nativiensis]|uniref:TetR/AcrR family transcriptional regulator n=1 Tax=[Mycobacterium] nativiensis TaxID=2855503 RepID=A0ABU5XR23_9MYCO|nr:TetR/AcrR family transcriptional regulator [Mycolicibacter sp. MYC340]MEB3030434.1 TetR/AcrR family transcriptional regulator [Mycolicibacter sp. MYC340]